MMKLLNTYKTFDIVVVPFPFTTDPRAKKRPALVLPSQDYFNDFVDHTICAMITSTPDRYWPHDVRISDLASCGLIKPSTIRFKIFTIDNQLIFTTIGVLSKRDQLSISSGMKIVFGGLLANTNQPSAIRPSSDQLSL